MSITRITFSKLLLIWLFFGLTGCASLVPDFDPPKVSVESIRNIPTEDVGPRFEIKLKVTNPNSKSLDIAGISYSIDFLGSELVNGVTNEIPVIEGYSEEVVTLTAGINMFQLLKVLANVGQAKTESMEYRFTAKIDFNGLVPTQRIEESGELSLK